MATQTIEVREFRDKLATYLPEAEAPLAVTRDGDTIGFFFPAPRKRTDADRAAFDAAFARWDQELASHGVTEDEAMADFELFRKSAHS